MADREPEWEIPALIAALDTGVAARLLAAHPPSGRCPACHTRAPCPIRGLAEATDRAAQRTGPRLPEVTG